MGARARDPHQRSPAPFFLDDLEDGYTALQDALDGVAFPPFGYDALYLQAYRTYSAPGPGYVAEFFRDMQREFGAAGQVSLGDTTQGPPYLALADLVADVRMLAGMGATAIPIFELGGTVQRWGAEGVRAIVEAGQQPLDGVELAGMTQESVYDRLQRDTFEALDTAAALLARIVTAPPGAPDGPNEYPDGCGNMHALPLTGDPVSPLSARPLTIPAMRLWTPAAGSFSLTSDSRIIALDESLLSDAEVLAEDLEALFGWPVAVLGAAALPGDGDITLDLGESDSRLGGEGYRLRIGDTVQITAIASAGAFHGTRTLLQLLHQNRYQGFPVPAGEALDWPRYPERGLMIDAGRVYFTPEWIEQHIKELAYLKMNYFHLHFSDDGGFRIESETHPEIVAEQHLTKQQVRDLIALAGRYHVMVVPELDMPGHLSGALAAHPELQLQNAAGQPNASRLDISNPAALQFARELMDELIPLFPAPYWHIGVDEYMLDAELLLHPQLQQHAQALYGPGATACDAVLGFANWANAIVKEHGKVTRMWHDELNCGAAVVTVDPDIIVEWWSNLTTLSNTVAIGPNELLARGHTIENSGWFPTYYTSVQLPDMERAYEIWDVHEFAGAFFSPAVDGQAVQDPPEEISPDETRNLGAKVNVWNTEPEGDVALGIRTFLRVIAQKTWRSPRLTPDYDEFVPMMDVIGHAPGYQLDARPTQTLPEPGVGWCAIAGAAGLALLYARRCARSVTPARPPS